jgi:phosphoketolase
MTDTAATARHELSEETLDRLDAWWRAANYLSVGQIYLLDNPLLRRPLSRDDIKPRLLGHWGTTPGLNFIYAHLNRAIQERDLNTLFVAGPGHGGPGVVASAYLDGTYSEIYSNIDRSEDGLRRLFRQFSFPGGIPSHAAPQTPGSIHEGGELGYALSHAYGAAFDNPELLVAAVVGDGEAETGPRRSCTSTATRSPTRPCSRASRSPSCSTSCAGTATSRSSSRAASTGRTRARSTSGWPPRSTRSSTASPGSRMRRAPEDREPAAERRPAA